MKLGIMQPYFLPYIGYFQLLDHVDRWVVFDDVQFIDKGWVNRNRILHPDPGKAWQYITVPIRDRGQFDRIVDLRVSGATDWRASLLGKLTSYRRKAPHYRETVAVVEECLDVESDHLVDILLHSLRVVAGYLEIATPIEVQSETLASLRPASHPGQWALNISERLGASEYVNPHGGYAIFRQDEFDEMGIKLTFLRPKLSPYVQRRGSFVPGLSIVDVMMWNDVSAIQDMLRNDYELLSMTELCSAGH